MRPVTSTLAVLVLLHSCQAEVILNIQHPSVEVKRSVSAHCERSPGVTYNNVQEIRFWGLNNKPNVNFRATRTCNDNNSAFNVIDTSDKRISLQSNFWLKWTNLSMTDTDSYKCSLTLCGASQPEESLNSVKVTVVTQPSLPTIIVTPYVKVAFINLEQRLEVTCQGNAGYPGGESYLRYERNKYKPVDTQIEVDSTGNFNQTQVFTHILTRYETIRFTCVSSNTGTTINSIYQKPHDITVEFPPTGEPITATKYSAQSISANHYVIKRKAPFESDVLCNVDSNPSPQATLSLVSGPQGFRLDYSTSARATVRVSKEQLRGLWEVEIVLKCESLYKSSLPEVPVINSTSTMSIFVNAGASLVKVSIGAFLATVLLLVKAFQ